MLGAPAKMLTNSLRRGFDSEAVKVNREEAILSPREMREILRKRMSAASENIRSVLVRMGSPNRKNLSKWRGREDKHRSPDLLRVYFSLADEVTHCRDAIKAINDFSEKHGIPIRNRYETVLIDLLSEYLPEQQVEEAKQRALLRLDYGDIDRQIWLDFVANELPEMEQ